MKQVLVESPFLGQSCSQLGVLCLQRHHGLLNGKAVALERGLHELKGHLRLHLRVLAKHFRDLSWAIFSLVVAIFLSNSAISASMRCKSSFKLALFCHGV